MPARAAVRLSLSRRSAAAHTLHDFLPDEQLREVENLHDFAGMLVFDKWTCNTNGRQTVFFSDLGKTADQAVTRYKTKTIDQGFCASMSGNGVLRAVA
jgi:hypothetical protein